jgi:hypothetical protein
MVAEIEQLEFPLDFCLWVWIKSEVYRRKLDTPDELLSVILDAAGCIKQRADQLRRTTRDLRTPVAKRSEVDGGILEHLLRTVTYVIYVYHIWLLDIKLKLKYN